MCSTRKTSYVIELCVVPENFQRYNIMCSTRKTSYVITLCVVPVENKYYNIMLDVY
jgi:hypothetical protein